MPDLTTIALVVYAIGVAIGLARTDDRWPTRIALAVLWPLGPLAFVVVVAVLYLALPIAFPVVGSIIFAIGAGVAYVLIAR
jgi:hypothetical protein